MTLRKIVLAGLIRVKSSHWLVTEKEGPSKIISKPTCFFDFLNRISIFLDFFYIICEPVPIESTIRAVKIKEKRLFFGSKMSLSDTIFDFYC